MLKFELGGLMIFKIFFICLSFFGLVEFVEDFVQIVQVNWYMNFGLNEWWFVCVLCDYLGFYLYVVIFVNGILVFFVVFYVSFGVGMWDCYLLMLLFMFVGVVQVVLWIGYCFWFIDIDVNIWQLCVYFVCVVIECFCDWIVGILLVNVFGVGNFQISVWEEFVVEWELLIVFDLVVGFGFMYVDGECFGGCGVCEIFFFYVIKLFVVGEGGVLVFCDLWFVEYVYKFQNFGLV